MKNLILPAADAQAVYAAMCALNAIGARLDAKPADGPSFEGVRVVQHMTGTIEVFYRAGIVEAYADQAAFAAAYGLNDIPSQLQALGGRLAYPDAGELLTLDDYRNIARNILQPDGVRAV